MTAHETTVDVRRAVPRTTERDRYTPVCTCGWTGRPWTSLDSLRPYENARLEGQSHVNDAALDRRGQWAEVDVVTCPRCETGWRYAPPEDRCDCGYTFPTEETA